MSAAPELADRSTWTPPRLLAGSRERPVTLADHVARHGPLVLEGSRAGLLDAVDASGLLGRGGAGFPSARKLAAVAAGRDAIVVANGVEGEPASSKDKVLLGSSPHLVIDGATVAAAAVGAREIVLAVARDDVVGRVALEQALAERGPLRKTAIGVVDVPDRFVAGEESALVHFLNGGPAKPTTVKRPYERGVAGRPTLVQNVETLANLALIARYGPDWFREVGTEAEPGTALVTVLGAVRTEGVSEVELGTPVRDVLRIHGGVTRMPRALLVGGYFGTWAAAHEILDLQLSDAAFARVGASLGARTIIVLPTEACGLTETLRIVRYLAGESAEQCGPCVFGLPAVADALADVVHGDADAVARVERLLPLVSGRGACAHPTGVARLVASALRVFRDDVHDHLTGRCHGRDAPPVSPIPSGRREWS